ncbi:MAG: family 10 glycosylhydrolase [Kiritimatiellaeota bacterium]|nr:family 10 glycosylhydrolase [Kiritimatiellota bacterium]
MRRLCKFLMFMGSIVLIYMPSLATAEEGKPFEISAQVDNFDFATIVDTDKPSGISSILDRVAETGATTILWRLTHGGHLRFQSKLDSHGYPEHINKRRPLDPRALYGWVRYGIDEPDILRTAMKLCKEKGLKPYIHWCFEEYHGWDCTLSDFNLEHPQFWSRSVNGKVWPGRCSLSYEPVMAHKLAILDEALERGVEGIYIDFWRNGGWIPSKDDYVEPVIASYKKKYGQNPPSNNEDIRWATHVAGYITDFVRQLHKHLDAYQKATGKKVELMVGIPYIAPLSNNRPLVTYGTDWQTWVKEGLIDTLVIQCVDWDKKNPFESTRELCRSVMEVVHGRCRVIWPIQMYPYTSTGIPQYKEATGKSTEEIAKALMQMAWEEGADGVTLECVDYDNYSKETRDLLRALSKKEYRFVRNGGK